MIDYRIQRAIEDSIRTNSIPTLSERIDTQEWVTLVNGLAIEAEDYVCITAGDNRLNDDVVAIREFWGVDEDGDEWRIHVHATR